jgi:predicted metalloprotease with PDZ domain
MMKFTYSFRKPGNHFLWVKLEIDNSVGNDLILNLPVWRPGRYEFGNFAKNLRDFTVKDSNGNTLNYSKKTKESWLIESKNAKQVVVEYSVYANTFDSGSTYIDTNVFYLNPVNCSFYIDTRMNEAIEVELEIPENFIVGTGLPQVAHRTYMATDYHQLADCPILASNELVHHVFDVREIPIHIWKFGVGKPDYLRIENDFRAFINHQMILFGHFPVSEYHFLLIVLPFRKYHGVEHINSTVLTLGPGYQLMSSIYSDLLELASHEFYHTWNIKQIRPVEMMPYDYSRENYFKTGYVAEGVTSYYGDICLLRCGLYNVNQYLSILSESIQKHLDNFGRFRKSLGESSIDLWLDGYEKGIPERKMSIYSDGCILAFVADVFLLHYSNGNHSLNTVMRRLYTDFAQKGVGFSESDYKNLLELLSGISFSEYFSKYVHGKNEYSPLFSVALDFLGLELIEKPSPVAYEAHWGILLNPGENTVTAVYPNSVAEEAGISVGDTILSINGYRYAQNLEEWSAFFDMDEAYLRLERMGHVKYANIKADGKIYYKRYTLQVRKDQNDSQLNLFNIWKSIAY